MAGNRHFASELGRAALLQVHWLMLTVALLLGAAVWRFVDLAPHVDERFFFASDDPTIKASEKIGEEFPAASQLYVDAAAPDITSEAYAKRVAELGAAFMKVEGVNNVRSIVNGPKNLQDALHSPLWRRLLIATDKKSTLLIISHADTDKKKFIADIEAVVARFNAPDFTVRVAGTAYVIELIRRNLVHDLVYFTVAAFVVFGFMIGAIFRSGKILIGTLATCFSAMALTLLCQQAVGMRMGVLTTNLSTMVFVITLSHIVFMTSNWRTIAAETNLSGVDLASAAWRRTLHPSFWCMVTTVMGFGSLLMVTAHPLVELGRGGVIGTPIAMLCAYVMYPVFLRWAKPQPIKAVSESGAGFWARGFVSAVALVIAACLVLTLGLPKLNTDPSVIDYFGRSDPIRRALEYVDTRGGSNPLSIVVRAADGGKLTTNEAYDNMWKFQNAMEKDKCTGSSVSLPVLMAEARRQYPIAALLPWDTVFDLAERSEFKGVLESFVTKDRKQAMFMARMVESERDARHTEVVERLKRLARESGLEPVNVGNIYFLQGQLADQVSHSVLKGLVWLIALFALVALSVTLSVRAGLAMIFALCLVPLAILGLFGLLGIPVDIISAPATNVCIGMAVDSMIHLARAVRRRKRAGASGWDAWVLARQEQWRGVVGSCTIVAAGFAIFALSEFPPTQRFGFAVVFGTMVAMLAALFVLPLLGGFTRKLAANKSSSRVG